jgi:hypothetical protein
VSHLIARFSYETVDPRRCPSAGQLKHQIQRGLDYDPFQPDAPLRLAIKITHEEAHGEPLTAEITVSDEHGLLLTQRRIRSPSGDCPALAAAAALAARLSLQPMVDAPIPGPPPAATAAPASNPAPNELTASIRPVETHAPERDWVLDVAALLAVGAVGTPSWGLLIGTELRWPSVSLGLQLRVDLPSSVALPIDATASGRISLLAVNIAPCLRKGGFSGCGLLVLGLQHSTGEGLDSNQTLDTFYGAGGVRAGYEYRPWRALGFFADADLLIPFARTELLVNGEAQWQTPPVSGVLSLGVETWIP